MKKFLVFAAAIVALTGAAFAQEDATSGNITASGTVIVPLSISVDHNLILPSNMPRSYSTHLLATDPNAAAITVTGDEGDYIKITWGDNASTYTNKQVTMTLDVPNASPGIGGTGNPTTFVVSLDCIAGAAQATASAYTGASNIQLGAGVGNGTLGFWFGGTPAVSATQQRGAYTGVFHATASYSN